MILGFKPQFVPHILSGAKIHTIREDVHDRWGHGTKIQMATGVRTKQYNCFKEAFCISTERIKINPQNKTILIGVPVKHCKNLSVQETEQLAINDGFPGSKEFWEWFNKPFHGKIIHWTDHKYIKATSP